MNIYPVIMSGGAGSRLWPVSRENFPKPLLPLVGVNTLLQETMIRLQGKNNVQAPIFVCNEEHRFLVAEQARLLQIEPDCILLEPEGRNTAPALTLSALYLQAHDEQAVMVVMPADHVIQNAQAFFQSVRKAVEQAQSGKLVTFGIIPKTPETGYGYIKKGAELDNSGVYQVAGFVEKPNVQTAQEYLATGAYLWNSGIFVLTPTTWLKELEAFRPDILEACKQAMQANKTDGSFLRVQKEAFSACPSDSIDYAVMEKTNKAVVVPLDVDWSDVGAWSSIWDIGSKDEQGNKFDGDVLTYGVKNSLVVAEHRLVAAVDVENIAIIETADAVLVVPRDKAQNVKEIVTQLKKQNRDEYKYHRKVYRPWGAYEGIDKGDRFQVKHLTVKPGASISLQLHHHRAEHWIVVQGTAEVTRGDEVFTLSENQSTYIPLGVKHRLKNPGKLDLEIIEIQSGSYLGEDDIVRFEDVYNRC